MSAPSIGQIICAAASVTGVEVNFITGENHDRHLVEIRAAISKLAQKHGHLRMRISRVIRRDHSTLYYYGKAHGESPRCLELVEKMEAVLGEFDLPTPPLETPGRRLARARLGARLSRSEVAFAVGVSDRAIGRWERDETSPDARYLPKLAEVLKRTQQWVKHGDDNAELAPEYASKLKTVVAPFPPGVDKLLLRGVSLLELSRKHPEWRIPNARNST